MPAPLSFSVVICAYTEKRWDDLIRVVESVQHQSLPPKEIILVIDHNEILLERAITFFQGIKVIENSCANGLAGARNSGTASALGDVVAFIDDDASADLNWLAELNKGYYSANVLGVGGAISPIWSAARPGWFPDEFNWVVGCTYRGMPQANGKVRNLIGCNMSFRKEVFEGLGGFRLGRVASLSLGQDNDETEYCIRLRQHWPQAELIYRSSAVVRHQVTPQRSTRRYFLRRCFSEGISKARLSLLVGFGRGTASERTYVTKTLPGSILRIISHALPAFDLKNLEQVNAIVIGLVSTVAGYVVGSLLLVRSPKFLSSEASNH